MDISNLGVTAIDNHTLKVDLEYSYEDFPSITSLPVFMPCNQAFFESTSGKYGLDAKNILGNGPFEMVNRYSWEHDEYINLTAANTYHGENLSITLYPYLFYRRFGYEQYQKSFGGFSPKCLLRFLFEREWLYHHVFSRYNMGSLL